MCTDKFNRSFTNLGISHELLEPAEHHSAIGHSTYRDMYGPLIK